MTVGTARLVLGDQAEPFPVEKALLDIPAFYSSPSNLAAEVSRLAVCKHAQTDAGGPRPWAGQIKRGQLVADKAAGSRPRSRNSPTVVLRLYRQMYRYSREHGIRYWYAAMEKSLLRVMARYGVVFTQIGPYRIIMGRYHPTSSPWRRWTSSSEATNPRCSAGSARTPETGSWSRYTIAAKKCRSQRAASGSCGSGSLSRSNIALAWACSNAWAVTSFENRNCTRVVAGCRKYLRAMIQIVGLRGDAANTFGTHGKSLFKITRSNKIMAWVSRTEALPGTMAGPAARIP